VGKRGLATAAPRSNVYREKTFSEAWCSDSGAYPVMGVIGFACVFCTVAGVWFTATHPDSRTSKYSRKSIFRGELKDAVARQDEEGMKKLLGL